MAFPGRSVDGAAMSQQKVGWSVVIFGMARAILHDRTMRRKFLARLLIADMAMLSVGLWVVNGWLAEDPMRFALWWLACGVLTIVLMLFALYDALAVIREERDKFRDD